MTPIVSSFFLPFARALAILVPICFLAGCSKFFSASGPTSEDIEDLIARQAKPLGIQLISVNDAITNQLIKQQKQSSFAESFPEAFRRDYVVGPGDVLEVAVWEAPPATLFGSSMLDTRGAPSTARAVTFPDQMVNRKGAINVPFVGDVPVAGYNIRQIEARIQKGLLGQAHLPQVLVRVTKNLSADVTVVGEVTKSTHVPLTPRGERLLDVLATAGGVRQPINKVSLQITRGSTVRSMPLDAIIRDPSQNIILKPGDIITALHQPLSFTALGAAGKNEEINFEAQGISLTQAFGRINGVQDMRADASGLFLFRWEQGDALAWPTKPARTPDGKVPVIYRVDLKDPATFLLAQSFPVKDKDVIYVANAPSAEFQKFLSLVMQIAYPVLTGVNLFPR